MKKPKLDDNPMDTIAAYNLMLEAPVLVAKAIKAGWMKPGRPLTEKEQEAAMQGRLK
jgi:hypothetical protein